MSRGRPSSVHSRLMGKPAQLGMSLCPQILQALLPGTLEGQKGFFFCAAGSSELCSTGKTCSWKRARFGSFWVLLVVQGLCGLVGSEVTAVTPQGVCHTIPSATTAEPVPRAQIHQCCSASLCSHCFSVANKSPKPPSSEHPAGQSQLPSSLPASQIPP